jgi:hypothetical protein
MKYEAEEYRPPYSTDVGGALGRLLGRCTSRGTTGVRPDSEAWAALVCDFERVIPPWYSRLILDFPICGRVLGWQSEQPEDFYDGVEWFRWAQPQETYACLCEHRDDFIARKKLFHIASSPFDRVYYFIPSDLGLDPAVYRLDQHPFASVQEVDLSLVVLSLSELFRRAIIPPQMTIGGISET